MWRLRAEWSGTALTGSGVTTFYALDDSPGFPAAAKTFLESFKSNLPTGVSIVVPNFGDVIDTATGNLTGAWTDGSALAGIGGLNSTQAFAKGVGLQVRWHTNAIVAGRRVVGSTFICPLANSAFDLAGTLSSSQQTSAQTAAAAYLAAVPGAVIWSRPNAAAGRVGTVALISGSTVPDRPSWLRSRRT